MPLPVLERPERLCACALLLLLLPLLPLLLLLLLVLLLPLFRFLIHPEPEDGHFYKTLPQVLWDCKAACLLLKTAAFAFAAYDRDEARIVDWALHSYGDMTFPGTRNAAPRTTSTAR